MMFTGDWYNWLILLGVIVIIAGLVYAAWWALFADRAKGRRRCPRCWYDLAYSPGMTCAECGFVGRRESDFHVTRRRYGVALLAILASVGVVLLVNERMSQRGYAAMLPTRVLLWLVPFTGDFNRGLGGEVSNRAQFGQLTDQQWIDLLERCAAGDWTARPTSDDWIDKYGDFIAQWRTSFRNDQQLEPILLKIPPRIDITTRDVWPEGSNIAVGVQLRDWWPWGMECRVRATPRLHNPDGTAAETITFYRSGDDRVLRSPFALDLPPLDPKAQQVTIDFEIARRRMVSRRALSIAPDDANGEAWEEVHTQTITVKTRIAGGLERLMQATSDPAMNLAVADVFAIGAVKWSTGISPVRFNINTSATFNPQFDDTAVGVSAELVRDDGAVARRLNLWWLGGQDVANDQRHYGFEIDFENAELLRAVNNLDGRWSMRVRGDANLALRAGQAKKYWQGELTLPLTLREVDNTSPPRAWWTDADLAPAPEQNQN